MYVSQLAAGLGGILTWRRFTITYQDLQATSGSGAQTLNLTAGAVNDTQGVITPGGIVLGVRAKSVTPFAGGSLSAMTVSVGKTGSATFFTSAYDAFAAVSDTNVQETQLFKHGQMSALQMTAVFTPTGGNANTATAGAVDIDILMLSLTTDLTTIP